MRIIDLALKDIRQILGDRRSLVFMLVMPVLFTLFFGFVFNPQPSEETDTRLQIGVINHDGDSVLSTVLLDMLSSSSTVRPVLLAEPDWSELDTLVVKDELAAGLIIPQGYSAGTLNGSEPMLEVILNEETDNGQTVRRALQTEIGRMLGTAQAARSSLAIYESSVGALDAAARLAYMEDTVRRAAQDWRSAPLRVVTQPGAAAAQAGPYGENPYNHFSPGMIIQFIMFGVMQAALVLVLERRNGAMARLLTTPMNKAEMIAGHTLSMFVLFFLQQLLLVVFGQLVLNVDYFREPLGTLLVVSALSLWVASLGLLIAALVKKEEQVVLFSMIAMFLFSALGGSWFSLEMVGKTFATIGHLTPTAWAIDGFQNIILRGQGLASVLLPSGIVIAYAALFFGIAIWKFRYE